VGRDTTAEELPDDRAIDTIRLCAISGWSTVRSDAIALLEPGARAQSFAPGPWSAHLVSVEDTRMTVDVSTANGGYVVLSEAQYPGWRVRIDGASAPIQRVDVMFQGAAVPAGRHTVVFELASTTQRAGIAISTLALALAFSSASVASAFRRSSTFSGRGRTTASEPLEERMHQAIWNHLLHRRPH
jgi:hypothetical protein